MNIIDQEKIGKFIASIRTKKGLKQDELGKRIGVSGKNISKWETGSTFPDVVYQLPLCNELGITLEELHTGCYNNKQRRSQLINRLYKVISLSLIAIIVPLLLFFFVYYITHNNSNKIYELTSVDKDFVIKGLVIDNYLNQTLYISEIKSANNIIKDDEIISINVYSKDDMIYHTNSFDSFVLQYKRNEKVDINNIHLIITVKRKNIKEYEISLISNKIEHNRKNLITVESDIDRETINNSLKNNGFVKGKNSNYRKVTKSKETINTIEYNTKTRVLSYENKDKSVLIYCSYYQDYNMMETYVYSYNGDIHTLIEKYNYNYSDKELTCQVGDCFSAEETIKAIEPYVNLLSSD